MRLEQMRLAFGDLLSRDAVRMPHPLNVIAFKTDEEYAAVAPPNTPSTGFYLLGEDRDYVVLNLAQPESWRLIEYPFAMLLLNGNYPPTQPWFDAGFAEYFASFRPADKQSSIGGDPESGALVAELRGREWMPISTLFAHPDDANRIGQFRAQSWITMHDLVNQDKLSETGAYLGLVETQKLSVDQAIQKAFGMSVADLEAAIKTYFESIAGKLQANQPAAKAPTIGDSGNIATSVGYVTAGEGLALVQEMAMRIPERRDSATRALNGILNDPKMENAIAHRTLAWDFIQKKQFEQAGNELNEALRIDPKDPWVHYYFAWMKYQASRASGKPLQGLPNMMQDLRIVLDWNPELAEAYNMLGLAQLQGGGANAAMQSMRAAIRLGPRREDYELNMADIYLDNKKWDAATNLLTRLETNSDERIASGAKKRLADLPSLKKYGRVTEGPDTAAAATVSSGKDDEASEVEVSPEQTLPPPPDKRPIKNAKGRLVSVDCSGAPAAVLSLAVGGKKMSLLAADYKSLVLIGAGEFSCAWSNRSVAVNYKAGGKMDGDLVSIEVQ